MEKRLIRNYEDQDLNTKLHKRSIVGTKSSGQNAADPYSCSGSSWEIFTHRYNTSTSSSRKGGGDSQCEDCRRRSSAKEEIRYIDFSKTSNIICDEEWSYELFYTKFIEKWDSIDKCGCNINGWNEKYSSFLQSLLRYRIDTDWS